MNFVWLFNFILYIFEDIRYTELSLLRVIFDVYTCKHFRPVMNSPEHISTIVVIWDIGIRLVLNLPSNNQGERNENKTEANVSLYTVVTLKRNYSLVYTNKRYMYKWELNIALSPLLFVKCWFFWWEFFFLPWWNIQSWTLFALAPNHKFGLENINLNYVFSFQYTYNMKKIKFKCQITELSRGIVTWLIIRLIFLNNNRINESVVK